MVPIRIFAAGLIVMLPCSAQWTQEQKEWALGTAAVLAHMNDDRYDVLGGAEPISKVAARDQAILAESWNIHSHSDLLAMVHSLLDQKTDRTRVAWNYPRAVNLLRWGYASGYIGESESWALMMPAAQRMQEIFSSWRDLQEAYIRARNQFFKDDPYQQRQGEYAYRVLTMDGNSPWRKYPWNLDLANGQHIPDAPDKAAEFLVTPHTRGLICVRLTTFDSDSNLSLIGAVEQAIGCRPRVTSERREKGNWIVDGECVRKEDVRRTQMVVPLRLEPIGEELRRKGVAQLFFYVNYASFGDSQLSPPAHDSWMMNGQQTYIDMRSLSRPLPDMTLRYGISEHDLRFFLGAAACFVLLTLAGSMWLRRLPMQPTTTDPILRDLLPTVFNLLYWALWLLLSLKFYGFEIAAFLSGAEGWSAKITALMWYAPAAFAVRLAAELIITPADSPLRAPKVPFGMVLKAVFWPVTRDMIFAVILLFVYNPENPAYIARVIVTILAAAISAVLRRSPPQVSLAEAKA